MNEKSCEKNIAILGLSKMVDIVNVLVTVYQLDFVGVGISHILTQLLPIFITHTKCINKI